MNERLSAAISDLRALFREYRMLNPEEQRAVRHLCYQQNGDFGKALFNLETVFGATEGKLETKYVASLRRRAAELGMEDTSVDVATLEAFVKRGGVPMSAVFRQWLHLRHISSGIGNGANCCSMACVNLFHRGVLDDATPKGMSKVLAIWIITVQDVIPDEMRNSSEWKDLLSEYVETTDREDGVRRAIINKWILEVVVPEYKPYMLEHVWDELQECNLNANQFALQYGFGALSDSFDAIRLGGIVSTVMRAFTGLIYGPYKGDFSGFKIYDTFKQLLTASP